MLLKCLLRSQFQTILTWIIMKWFNRKSILIKKHGLKLKLTLTGSHLQSNTSKKKMMMMMKMNSLWVNSKQQMLRVK